MNKLIIVCSLLIVFCLAQSNLTLWDLWFTLPRFANPTWVYPTPPAGFNRLVATSPFENEIFSFDRSLQYIWSNGTAQYTCGPKAYLNQAKICQRHPQFWEASESQYCSPLVNGICVPRLNFPCCYINNVSLPNCHEKNIVCETIYVDSDVAYQA